MEKFFSLFLEIFLKSACGKFTAILEQNFKVNVDQHASKIMWFYGLRKITFGRCLMTIFNILTLHTRKNSGFELNLWSKV